MSATMVLEEKWPVLGRHERAAEWLRVWVDLGRAPRTIDAYARGLAEYLQMCERDGVDPLGASKADIACFVRELTERPSHRGTNVVSIDSGAGLANATIQQRIVPVRLFYDHLMEEGLRESNPVVYRARTRPRCRDQEFHSQPRPGMIIVRGVPSPVPDHRSDVRMANDALRQQDCVDHRGACAAP